MEDVRFTYNDLIIYFTIINTLLGLLFGIFPLVVGLKNGNRKFAFIGLIASIVGGFILSVFLAFPAALIFTILGFRSGVKPAVEPDPVTAG
jgi:hypothetical protein